MFLILQLKAIDWLKEEDSTICWLKINSPITKDAHRLKVKRWKMIFQANKIQNQSGVSILMSEKQTM